MHEIFINYRTQGGKEVGYMCDAVLSARFGTKSVFLAKKSLEPGRKYAEDIIEAVHRCHVLLALIDEHWLDAPDLRRPGRRALDNPQDWVRREIEEALDSGVLVVPLFIGRRVEQLDPNRLPKPLAELAEHQYARVELHSKDTDLARLGDRLARQVPELARLDSQGQPDAPADPAPEPSTRMDHQSGGIGQVGGSVGSFVNEAHGPLHTGSGNQYDGPHISGDGTNYIAGDNSGAIRQRFGSNRPQKDDER
ncbi:TIR domain-containing protein [Streptomyces sp. NPDC059002]|uniref:TIR domain-containing protein n=1 Tax=Streptomyces sp. NPDC059002 TaxID=3346690 RepID=UPI0036D02DBC